MSAFFLTSRNLIITTTIIVYKHSYNFSIYKRIIGQMNKTIFNIADEGYYFIYTELEQTLLNKNGNEIHSFAENPINYSYITKAFTSELEKQTFKIQKVIIRDPDKKVELPKAIEMSIVLEGARQFLGLNKK
jgi:hypothetical protein